MTREPSTAMSDRLAVYGWLGVVAGVLGVASAFFLLAVEPAVARDRFSYPFTPVGFAVAQGWFFVQHLGLLAALYGLWQSGSVGTSWPGRLGSWGAMAGMSLLAVTELVAISAANSAYPSAQTGTLDGLYGVSSILIGASLIVAGIAVIRAGRWHGWRRVLPLLLGLYVFVPLTPALFASWTLARLAIAGWMLGFAVLGWALVETAKRAATASTATATPS
jgi:hypothetical protein